MAALIILKSDNKITVTSISFSMGNLLISMGLKD
jgi:hypothetical protein